MFPDGVFYDGFWLKGQPHIIGRFIWPNEDLYEGLIQNGTPHGKGIIVNNTGYKYAGFWKEGKKHGLGQERFPKKGFYQGEFKNGQQHGNGKRGIYYILFCKLLVLGERELISGILRLNNGNQYEGQFFKGKFNGTGTFLWKNGSSYTGEWAMEKKHGTGSRI